MRKGAPIGKSKRSRESSDAMPWSCSIPAGSFNADQLRSHKSQNRRKRQLPNAVY